MKQLLKILLIGSLINCARTNDTVLSNETTSVNNKRADASEISKVIAPANNTIIHLDLNAGYINPSNGGCTFEILNYNGTEFIQTTAAFGPNPVNFFGYQFRGSGKPRTDMTYKGIAFVAGNGKTISYNQGVRELKDKPAARAISLEHNFEPNFTYEITIVALLRDNIYYHSLSPTGNNDAYDVSESEANPTIAVELKQSPEINIEYPCGIPFGSNTFSKNLPVVNRNTNYAKKHTYERTTNYTIFEQKTYVFNISPKITTNGLIIYFMPNGLSPGRTTQDVNESAFQMHLTNLKVVKKPFNSSYYDDRIGDTYNPTDCVPGGGFRCP